MNLIASTKQLLTVTLLITLTGGMLNLAMASEDSSNEECNKFISSISATYQHGFVEVPEDYSKPNGNKIKVLWYTKMKKGQTPVMFFYGGPLYDDRMHFNLFAQREDKFNLGFIYMDQRGTGCSGRQPNITDQETARRASLYSSENIVRDAEEVRKTVLGTSTQWKIFGQSFGGYVVDQYLTLFPSSIISAHAYAGGADLNMTQFYHDRMMSNLRTAEYFFNDNPGSKEKLKALKSMFKLSMCYTADIESEGNKMNFTLCGEDLYHEIAEYYLLDVSQWDSFMQLLNNPTGPQGIFSDASTLNTAFWKAQTENNSWYYSYFFAKDKFLKNYAIRMQDSPFAKNEQTPGEVCKQALQQMSNEGIDIQNIAYNHCRKNIIVSQYPEIKKGFSFLTKVAKRTNFSRERVFKALQKNPQIPYFAYTAKYDSVDVWTEEMKNRAQLPNVTYHFIEDSDHGGYIDQSQVWKDLSGLDISLLDSKITMKTPDNKVIQGLAVTAANGLLFKGKTISGQGVYVGYADVDFDDTTKVQLKGNIALISRGRVALVDKIKRALEAGASGVIVGNSFKTKRPQPIGIAQDTAIPVFMMEMQPFSELLNNVDAMKSGVSVVVEISND